MYLLKKLSFWLSIAGIGLTIYLVWVINTPRPPAKPVSMPARNPYIDSIAASGIVEATDRNIAISAPLSGLVNKLYVSVGQIVQKGDPLFQLDARDLVAQEVVQQANVKVAAAQVLRLKDQLARFKSVKDPRAISADDVNTRENDVKVAQAQLEAFEAQLKQTALLIDRLTVHAPKTGKVLQNNIREGEYLLANMSPPAILLGDTTKLQVRVDIDEQNASRFSATQPAVAFPKNNTDLEILLKFERLEPYVLPKKSLTGSSDERVDTRVLQIIYSFDYPKNFNIFVGQQVDVFIKDTAK